MNKQSEVKSHKNFSTAIIDQLRQYIEYYYNYGDNYP